MAESEADRNVLIGILAWQSGLIDRAALMEAMYECTTTSGATLLEILSRKRLLSDDDRRRLEQVVDGHLQGHKNDVGKTLSSFDSVDEVKQQLTQIAAGGGGAATIASDKSDNPGGTIDSHAPTLAGMPTIQHYDSSEARFTSDVAPGWDTDVSDLGSSAGTAPGPAAAARFRVVRKHARGGLGEVFVALDEQLKREVAVKQILPKQLENVASLARFRLEAEITGNLEHPGIVPVYALGQQADGCPYYAMRFIRGESLEDAIVRYHSSMALAADSGKRALELRNLLTRFIGVCNTLEYAHSRGIIHRDIKPENIMLGPYAETLVVDWGLARQYKNFDPTLDSDLAHVDEDKEPQISQSVQRPTQMGSVVGTPQFMSPEQASGRLDLMGPASDIYSLGATLYCLLTDQPPFTASDVRQVLKDVKAGNFNPPRTVRSDVPAALNAICLKAMALMPEERYASAHALAADLERWLADEPVAAHQETALQRAQRWMRRHKTLTRVGAAALLTIACVAGVAYAREASLRSDLQEALVKEEAARSEADKQRAAALASAAQARRQNDLAFSTLYTVVFEVQNRLKNVPAAQAVRLSMLDKAVEGLTQVASSLEGAADLDPGFVRAHLEIGNILFAIDTGSAEGATAQAEEQFVRAREVAEKLVADPARRKQAETELGEIYLRLGDVAARRGRGDDGTAWFKKSLELRERLARERAGDVAALRDLAASVQRVGIDHLLRGERSDARTYFIRYHELAQRLVDEHPDDAQFVRMLSVAKERLADVAQESGDLAEARRYLNECLTLRESLLKTSKNGEEAERDLSVTLDRLGQLAQEQGDLKTAEEHFRRGFELRQRLYERDTNSTEAIRDLVIANAQLGDICLLRDSPGDALKYFDAQLQLTEYLALADRGNVQYLQDLAQVSGRLAQTNFRLGKLVESRDLHERRLRILEELTAAAPDRAELKRELSNAYRDFGEAEQFLGRLTAAREPLKKYLETARARLAGDKGDASLERVVADACFRNGLLELRVGDVAAAGGLLQEATRLALKGAEAARDDESAWSFLVNVETAAAEQAWQARDAERGAEIAASAIKHLEKLEPQASGDTQKEIADWRSELHELLERFADARRTVADEAFAAKRSPSDDAELLDFRAVDLTKKKQPAAARAVWDKMASAAERGSGLLIASRGFSRLAAAAENAQAGKPDVDRALEILQAAYDAGLLRSVEAAARLEVSPVYDVLRQEKAFQELLRKVQAESGPSSKSGTVT